MYEMTKRLIDITGAAIALLVLFPLILVSMLAVRLSLGSPVLFRQQRPGLGGKPFTLVKLRTMRNEEDRNGQLLSDAERMTVLGWFLRSTSIDELPSLWNVLRGEMSLVGPRPLLMQYLDLYTPEQARRNEVKPGITGWAQVNGRNDVGWEDRLAMDVWYVDNRSLALDLKILFMTIGKVFKRQGIAANGHATMPMFAGSVDAASRDLYLYGAGGHARVILATAEASGREVKGIFDDDVSKAGRLLDGVPILGTFDAAVLSDAELVLAIGDNAARRHVAEKLDGVARWATIIHPHAVVHRSATVGPGTVVFAGCVVQPGSYLGRHSIINTGATVDHDCTIGNFVHVAPGAHLAGGVAVDDGAMLGIGACVLPYLSIGAESRVGAGGVVTDDVGWGETVIGVPARSTPQIKAMNGALTLPSRPATVKNHISGMSLQAESSVHASP